MPSNWSDEDEAKARELCTTNCDGECSGCAAIIIGVKRFAAWDRERQRQGYEDAMAVTWSAEREELARLRKVAEAARWILDNGSLGFTRDRLAEALSELDAVKP